MCLVFTGLEPLEKGIAVLHTVRLRNKHATSSFMGIKRYASVPASFYSVSVEPVQFVNDLN